MLLTKIVENLYEKQVLENNNLTKSITLSNSLKFLQMCADLLLFKEKNNKGVPRLEKLLTRRGAEVIVHILEMYENVIIDLKEEGLCVETESFYKIQLSDGYEQILYKPQPITPGRFPFKNILTILNTVYLKLSDTTIDMVFKDNQRFKTLVSSLNTLINWLDTGLTKTDEIN